MKMKIILKSQRIISDYVIPTYWHILQAVGPVKSINRPMGEMDPKIALKALITQL